MGVLINGMDIPKSCSDCPLNHDEMSCTVTGTRWRSDTMILLGFDYTKERLHDCPLSEVPSAQSKKFSEVLRDMMDEDYYLFCYTGYSRLAEKDWEWLIEQVKEMEREDGNQ